MGEVTLSKSNDTNSDAMNKNLNLNTSNTHKLQNSLNLFHQNICGLKHKIDELYSSLYPDLPHVLCITEHHLNRTQLLGTGIDNYILGANYCRRNSINGGACIFIQNSMTFTQVDIKNYCSDYDMGACAPKIHLNRTVTYILAIYRSPAGGFAKFLKFLDNILKLLMNSKTEIIICGDINVNYLTNNNRNTN
jgi:exonuclease III